MKKSEVISLLDDTDDIVVLPSAKKQRISDDDVIELFSTTSAAKTPVPELPRAAPVANKFDVKTSQLPTLVPFKHDIQAIYGCLQEILQKSPFRITLDWQYTHPTDYFKPTLTITGRGSNIYTFRIVFQVSLDGRYFPSVPPRLVPHFVLPAPLFVTIYNHPALTSAHWSEATASALLCKTVLKTVEYLDRCLGESAMIYSSTLPGQLGVVSRGRDWLSLAPQDICVEYIIAELYGDYQHCGRFSSEDDDDHSQDKEGIAGEMGRLKAIMLKDVLEEEKKSASSSSSKGGAVGNKGKGKGSKPAKKVVPTGKGIGYSSSNHAPYAASGPPQLTRFTFLLNALHEKLDYCKNRLFRSQKKGVSWVLDSPLAEVYLEILGECSPEEVYRRGESWVGGIFNDIYAIEGVMKEVYGKEWIEKGGKAVVADAKDSDVILVESSPLASSTVTTPSSPRAASLLHTLLALYTTLHTYMGGDKGGESLIQIGGAAAGGVVIAGEWGGGQWLRDIQSYSRVYARVVKGERVKDGEDEEEGAGDGEKAKKKREEKGKVLFVPDLLPLHAFRNATSGGGGLSRHWLREMRFIEDSLSPEITLLISEESPSHVIALLQIPNVDCPYFGGVYVFHIYIPASYPSTPPQVKFMTTGGGVVRFNPNLYNCGKVCLSLLGTWQGEPWDPKNSNLTQVLKSILYLIFTEDPYFNEPGYQSSRNTPHGTLSSLNYDISVFTNMVQYGIMYQLERKGGGLGTSAQGDSVYNEILSYYVENWDAIVPILLKKLGEYKGKVRNNVVAESTFKGWINRITAVVNAERERRTMPSVGKAGKV